VIKVSPDPNENWKNDAIQFPRLLAEIWATIDLVDHGNFDAVCEAMDLNKEQVTELFERATATWDRTKAATPAQHVAASHAAARTVSVEWTELSRYSVNIALPADAPADPDALKEWLEEPDPTPVSSGEDRWFDLVEAQAPDWATQDVVEVSDRQVEEITILESEENPREKGDDDGAEYADPRDEQRRR
jgi:hypothetical protein